ncbi:Membrane-bound lysozyme-inhibitor of c-type lysozyme [Pseudomonas sp. 8Z]|uniref:MliC family protein n=1 Tax=Pseudomonas sp. 8Z TaxID=2653166 RepID=UPI0012F1C4C1|nr:Membrane-bound lysozyme-inhibitor of c-type lysozyme [Pseudomonas sp. 8Z]
MIVRLAGMTAMALLLGACSQQQTAPEQWTHWVCDSKAEVLWRQADGKGEQVDIRLGSDDVVHRLTLEPAGSGALYSDGNLSFHTQGDEGLVYWTATDDLIGRGCKAP